MVESKLRFFEVQLEGTLGQAIEPGHASLCLAGEIFDTVDVAFARGEPIGTVVHSEMLVETDIKQTIVIRAAFRMNHRSRINVAPHNHLQCGLGVISHAFCIDHALTLKQPKDNRLPVGATSATTPNPVGTEVGFIHFNRPVQKRGLLTSFSRSLAGLQLNRIHRTKQDTRHFRSTCYREIHHKTTHQLVNFGLAYSRTAVAPVFSNLLLELA